MPCYNYFDILNYSLSWRQKNLKKMLITTVCFSVEIASACFIFGYIILKVLSLLVVLQNIPHVHRCTNCISIDMLGVLIASNVDSAFITNTQIKNKCTYLH